MKTKGIHHISAMVGNPQENLGFLRYDAWSAFRQENGQL